MCTSTEPTQRNLCIVGTDMQAEEGVEVEQQRSRGKTRLSNCYNYYADEVRSKRQNHTTNVVTQSLQMMSL